MTPTPSIFSRRPLRPVPALVAAAAIAVIAAGCGGNSPSSTSSGAAAAQGGPGQAAYRFSACMRNHGVTNFPDPKVTSSASGNSVAIAINPSISGQPAFGAAQKACQHILGGPGPGTGPGSDHSQVKTQALIAFARCLRAHGFPHFPDPDATGQLSPETIRNAGIDFHTPALLTAGRSCASATHGQITPAQVTQAINHANASGSETSTTP